MLQVRVCAPWYSNTLTEWSGVSFAPILTCLMQDCVSTFECIWVCSEEEILAAAGLDSAIGAVLPLGSACLH